MEREPEAPRSREARVERVRKRDGRVVAFDLAKIRDAVAKSLESVGTPDVVFAGEVASVVELALRDRVRAERGPEPFVPDIEAIQDLVERALMELDRPAAAKAYILYREQRRQVREVLRVHGSRAPSASARAPRVREAQGVAPWSRSKLVASLMREAELGRDVAEEIAHAVERRVFASGQKRITTGLIRELVTGELLERGLARAGAALSALGIPRHDLLRLFAGAPLQPWETEAGLARPARTEDGGRRARGTLGKRVSAEVLQRFALDELLPGEVGEFHRAGDIHVEDLGTPHLALSMAVDASLFAAGGNPVTSAYAMLDGIAELLGSVSRVLVLERPAEVLSPLMRSVRAGSPLGLPSWFAALSALARARGVRIDIGSSGPRPTGFLERCLEALAEAGDGPFASRIFLEGHELEALLKEHPSLETVVEGLFADGRLHTTWGEPQEFFVGPGCHRREREQGILCCGGAIALNLPRLARRAGPWREDLVQSAAAELVGAAVEAASALGAFQRSIDARLPTGIHVRRSFAIVPIGLRETLLALGEGEIDVDQGARLLGLLSEAARRFARERGLSCVVSPFFGERAARRFAWLDGRIARAEGVEQGGLFHDEDPSSPASPPYGDTLRFSPLPHAAAGRAEADGLRTLTAGALSFVGLPGLRESGEALPHLSAWRRFEVLRRARSGELALELFPASQPGPRPADRPHPPVPPLRPHA
jgi:hypothetical protein